MSKLFEATTINGMRLSNRFVRSATWEGMAADDGTVTPKLIETNVALARGCVGLIISGHCYVRREGQAGPWQLGISSDNCIPGLRSLTEAVHKAGGKIVAQLAHAGNFASEALTGEPPWVVSNFAGLANSPRREMTAADIKQIVLGFAEAAGRAKLAGFDGVQLHSAHGYLLSQFLSPAFNKRQDNYGGDIRNRGRVHLEALHAIRDAVGKSYPVLIKMNCCDFIDNGLMLDDSLKFAELLADAGIDAIELSGGTLKGGPLSPSRVGIDSEDKEAFYREEARDFKKRIGVPLIVVGGMRSFEVAEQLVEDGVADYIALSRPLIREPHLIERWKQGDRRKAECKSDNLCFRPALKGAGIYCVNALRQSGKA